MKKERYYYNPSSLKFEKIETSWGTRIVNGILFLGSSVVFAALLIFVAGKYFPSATEMRLQSELSMMTKQYKLVENQMDNISRVLESLREQDNNIYRVIFEREPIPDAAWEGYKGGAERYRELKEYSNYELMKSLLQKVDKINHQLDIQTRSYGQISQLLDDKTRELASIPSIQPIAGKDLTRMASGYGWRTDPIYKVKKFHHGMDFSAPTGTPIYATGDGRVEQVTASRSRVGYGMHIVIDHGYGYKTRYAHMSRFNVRKGVTVKRGEIIGFVGNTGKSVGPHLHYEVEKDGKTVNPVHYYYNDITPAQYEELLVNASAEGQSLD